MKLENKLGLYLTAAIIAALLAFGLLLYGFLTMPTSGYIPLFIGIGSFVISQIIIRKHFIRKDIS